MNKRTAVSAAELYVMLNREFKRRQPRDCSVCYIQLPYRVDRRDGASANWELVSPMDCSKGCKQLVDELVLEYSRLYDLNGDPQTQTQH